MNVQLSQVLSDIMGETGQRIVRAIVEGERDPRKLAALRNYHCKKDEGEIAKALTGTWRAEHLFVLKQSLALYDFYTQQIEACDAEIERTYTAIRPQWDEPNNPYMLPAQKPNSCSKNSPQARTSTQASPPDCRRGLGRCRRDQPFIGANDYF